MTSPRSASRFSRIQIQLPGLVFVCCAVWTFFLCVASFSYLSRATLSIIYESEDLRLRRPSSLLWTSFLLRKSPPHPDLLGTQLKVLTSRFVFCLEVEVNGRLTPIKTSLNSTFNFNFKLRFPVVIKSHPNACQQLVTC